MEKAVTIKGSSGVHDSFITKTLPEALILTFLLLEKKALGKDRLLGQAELDVWKYISPGSTNAADCSLSIGSVNLRVTLAWTGAADNTASPAPARIGMHNGGASPDSPASLKSKSRFSLHRKS